MKKFQTPEEVINKIREYYQTAELYLPNNPQWRYFKFRTPTGSFLTFTRIRDKNKLRKLLIKYTPIDVYYSSSKFTNPRKIKGALTKEEDLVLIDQDVIIDIDLEDNESFDKAISIAKRVVKKLGKPEYIIRTSKRGIQLCFYKPLKCDNLWHKHKVMYYVQERTNLIKGIRGIDKKITIDIFRVVRLPKTLHHDGNVVNFINLDKIEKLKYIFQDKIILPKSPNKAMTAGTARFPSQNKGKESRVGIIDLANSYSEDYLSNCVLGTKGLYVPLLIYHSHRISNGDTNNPINEIKRLMKIYDIPIMYLLKDDEYLYALSLITMDGKRLSKVLNKSSSLLSQKMFNKYKQIFMRISPYGSSNQNLSSYGIIHNLNTNKKYKLSKSHLAFLLSKFGIIHDKGKYIGKEETRVMKTWKN